MNWKNIVVGLSIGLIILFVLVVGVSLFWLDDDYLDEDSGYATSENCNVAHINLHGDILVRLDMAYETEDTVSSRDIARAIESAEANNSIEGVLIDIDSYGGLPLGGDEVEEALKALTKPSVALIRNAGLSAAYWAATGADWIVASDLSDVGSIGVTMSYTDEDRINKIEGYTFNSLSFGKYKDAGHTDKPLTYEERKIFERDVKIIYDKFVEAVAENRNIEINKAYALADGSSMLGEMALKAGLIDELGSYPEAIKHLKSKLDGEAVVCWSR